MAIASSHKPPQVHRLPQSKYVDAARWLSPASPITGTLILAFYDTDTAAPSLEIHSVTSVGPLTPLSTWTPPSRISSVKCSPSIVAAATVSPSLFVFSAAAQSRELSTPDVSLNGSDFHIGRVGDIDLAEEGGGCVTVGEDGRVNLVTFVEGSGHGSLRRIYDGNGLVAYDAVRWASPFEFVTGGYGSGLQWWDLRRPESAVSKFMDKRHHAASGIVHSIDIHLSRKHTCLAGGSMGRVFAWDMRWQQQCIVLSGIDGSVHSPSESDVWEVKYDPHISSPSTDISSSPCVLPAMICSEDGILAVIEQGKQAMELLAEPCAINSFDVHPCNPTEVVCCLEWESIAMVSRR